MFGLFKRHDVELSAEVRGCITDNGKPVAGIEVVRRLMYEGYEDGKEQVTYASTDSEGQFSFEKKVIKSRMPGRMFGASVPVLQSIYIEKDNPEDQDDHYYFLWSTSKSWRSIAPLSALMLKLNGDLQNKAVHHEINTQDYGGRQRQPIISICHWQGELISTYFNNELIASYDEIS
ncbi:DUF6795 domain-containing protein [Thalassomonas actiniarum]|uniref:Carboxypeptidase regulatory-like domain-containing protein n=1 Tax=Thalassomonas actiniarum TaxID=485447 RepID=A0AAE9YVK7_9GAMM|nr:DUF6795 domain-containing protein [Thalassomonas actiniarum]WDE01387.1 carboxypeptidase regulatory-like domain-containing protein [Thalassomonas actiniarum]